MRTKKVGVRLGLNLINKSISPEISWQRKIMSFLISFPYRVIRVFCKRKVPIQLRKILVIQWDYLGDIVVSTPALKKLRQIYASSEIHLLTSPENESYISHLPFVNKILYVNNPLHIGRSKFAIKTFFRCVYILRREKYDLIVELTGRLPNQIFLLFLKTDYNIGLDPANNFYFLDRRVFSKRKPQVERYFDVIKAINNFANINDYYLPLWNPVTDEERIKIYELLQARGIYNNYIVVHPTASWKPKQWPIERWAEVLNFLLDKKRSIVFIGVSQEYQQIEQIRKLLKNKNNFNFAGLVNVRQVIALMEKGELFIGSDSGPMHLAAVANIRGIVLFGPGDPVKWTHPLHTIIYKGPSCGPCPQFAFKNVCVEGLTTCKGLLAITPSEIIRECEKLLLNR